MEDEDDHFLCARCGLDEDPDDVSLVENQLSICMSCINDDPDPLHAIIKLSVEHCQHYDLRDERARTNLVDFLVEAVLLVGRD